MKLYSNDLPTIFHICDNLSRKIDNVVDVYRVAEIILGIDPTGRCPRYNPWDRLKNVKEFFEFIHFSCYYVDYDNRYLTCSILFMNRQIVLNTYQDLPTEWIFELPTEIDIQIKELTI